MNRQQAAGPLLFAVLFLATACGGQGSSQSADLLSDRPVESSISMAVDSLDSIDLPSGSTVLIPTNSGVLGLPAAALAGVASEGDLSLILEHFVFETRIDIDELDDPFTVTSMTDLKLTVRQTPDGIMIGKGRIVSEEIIDGQHVLVLEGLFG